MPDQTKSHFFLFLALFMVCGWISCFADGDDDEGGDDDIQINDDSGNGDDSVSDDSEDDDIGDDTDDDVIDDDDIDDDATICDDDESLEEVWIDEETGLMWQNGPTVGCFEGDVFDYCNPHLWYYGWAGYFDGWRVPTISEYRSLIRGCPNTETAGSCGIRDDCLMQSCDGGGCVGCEMLQGPTFGGAYWPTELTGHLVGVTGEVEWWSSSEVTDGEGYWFADFRYGRLDQNGDAGSYGLARCVRDAE
jgi:hypothetical protein